MSGKTYDYEMIIKQLKTKGKSVAYINRTYKRERVGYKNNKKCLTKETLKQWLIWEEEKIHIKFLVNFPRSNLTSATCKNFPGSGIYRWKLLRRDSQRMRGHHSTQTFFSDNDRKEEVWVMVNKFILYSTSHRYYWKCDPHLMTHICNFVPWEAKLVKYSPVKDDNGVESLLLILPVFYGING